MGSEETLGAATRIGTPLPLEPTWDVKTWGGRRLEALGKSPPPGCIGEALETGPRATVTSGPCAGRSLADLNHAAPLALLGRRGAALSRGADDIPLLVKLIDARETLSVQVHPDDSSAPSGKRGKTEAWVILDAEPGATIVTGVSGPIEIDTIAESIIETQVTPGEAYIVPAGAVHAIGAGVLLYEIQQASDVTWRLYDWGRPREIHVETALATARPERSARRVAGLRLDDARETLVACRHFALERWRVAERIVAPETRETFRIMTVIEGSLTVGGVVARSGHTVLLPADLPETVVDGAGVALVGYLPDIEADVVRPLLAAGHSMDSIERLGLDAP